MPDFFICPSGVTKSIVGEITDSSNQAEAFALTFVVYGVGATVGYDHLPSRSSALNEGLI